VWVELHPNDLLGLPEGYAAPEARYEQREARSSSLSSPRSSTLSARQRAMLILREVFGFPAREVCEVLDTSVVSVSSALQRGRNSLEQRVPERSRAADASPARRRASQEIVDAYIDAWNRRRDVDELRSLPGRGRRLLDAAAGDPVAGPDAIVAVAEAGVDACPESRAVLTHANGQPAIAYYNVDSETDTCPPRSTSSRSTGSPSPRSPAS